MNENSESSGQDEIDLDVILSEIGDFGKFQVINFLLLSVPIILGGAHSLVFIFTAGNLDYRCIIPECDDNLDSLHYNTTWFSNGIPYRNSEYSKCSYYGVNKTIGTIDNCTGDIFNKAVEINCNSNFIYKTNEKTIVNEFNITCKENEWKLSAVGTASSAAVFIFMPFAGFISDRFGRKTLLLYSMLSSAAFGIIGSFSLNYWMFIITEFLAAGFGAGSYTAVFILSLEILSPSKRVLAATLISAAYAIGEACLGGIAYYSQDFRITLRVLYVPVFLLIAYFWLIPESLRWLLVRKKYNEAIEIIYKIAKTNGKSVSSNTIKVLNDCTSNNLIKSTSDNSDNGIKDDSDNVIESDNIMKDENGETITDLSKSKKNDSFALIFKSSSLLIRIINCVYCWFTINLVYYGLSLNAVELVGDKYVNYILACLIEIPGFLLCQFLLDVIGRRWSLSISLLLSGIACILAEYFSDNPIGSLILFLFGKCAITFSFSVIYVQTAELFPTNIRHTIMSACSTVGHMGSTVAPLSPLLANYMSSLPFLLFGSTSVIAGITCLHFPETLNIKLPDTIEEAENIGKSK